MTSYEKVVQMQQKTFAEKEILFKKISLQASMLQLLSL